MDPVKQVRVAAARIIQTVENLNREGHEWAVLEIALVDTMVRFEKTRAPHFSTAAILRRLSTVMLEMATDEDAQALKEQH